MNRLAPIGWRTERVEQVPRQRWWQRRRRNYPVGSGFEESQFQPAAQLAGTVAEPDDMDWFHHLGGAA